MVDPYNKNLQKPIHRGWLRRRLGRAAYAMRRYLLWHSPMFSWAKHRSPDRLPQRQFSHATPLIRNLNGDQLLWQTNKVTNLKLATARIDGIVLYPGETMSYWRLIGKPSRRKGYREGMMLSAGRLCGGIGGGLCQLSNLIFWMTLHTPLTVVERYRHSHDVFPDSNRTQPFGSGATCSYPHRDLMIRNDTDQPFQLCVRVGEEMLEGEWRAVTQPEHAYHIVEKDCRMDQAAWGGYVRHNALWREVYSLTGELEREEFLLVNDAIMMYNPLLPTSNPS